MMQSVDPEIEQLLILQDRDSRLYNIEQSLKTIPLELAKYQAKIAEEEAAIAAAHKELQQLEVRRKDLDNDVKSAEEQIVKYKNQQLQVKKNDEYQALTHEIELTENKVNELEEAEIGLMLEIDEGNEQFAKAKAESDERLQLFRDEIETLQDREQTLKGEIEAAKADVAKEMSACNARYLQSYERVKRRRPKPPFVSAIEDHKCGGCHLKVSSETESATRQKSEPVHCENCGRIVYWEL
ncbi:zinc ribbon domain-containing protein [Cerasicoccus fimbriatus]|uniref:zinc ribbon domain-containing protein n=1 Tax=Cerasicoccus fimbriatus TaxID=3014554 RepID=UPI0022B3F77B|nr:C4-type zinc ribbon domain-containing protein [Cerasicoccus sp. TK19100]